MKYFSFASIAVLILLMFSSCDDRHIRGNGRITSNSYDIKNFTGIDAGGFASVYLQQDSNYSVRVEADENILPLLEVAARGGVLNIGNKENFSLDPTGKIKIYLSMPVVENIDISGASSIETKNKFTQKENVNIDISGASSGNLSVHSPKVTLDVSGASTLNIDGETRDVAAEVSGASTLNAFNLKAENTQVDASGASSARVFASVLLSGDASGASNISYKGKPQIKVDTDVAGSIKQAE